MKMLNASQIDRLYQFTRQHYVEFYDVQTELVDHLANGIEAQWKEDPEMRFEDALQKEFKKFGVFGFSDVVEKRQRAMEKKYWKFIWKEAKSMIQEPKMAFSILILFCFSFFLLTFQNGVYVLMALVVILLLFTIIFVAGKTKDLRKKKKKGEKIYLLETIIFNAGGSFSLLWIPFHILNLSDVSGNLYVNLLMSLFIVVIMVTGYICFYQLPKKKDEILKKVHPELKYL